MSTPRVLLHGAGGVGTVYLYLLSKAGFDVTAVCRSNYAAIKSNGFLVDSDIYGKGNRFHPKAVKTPTEAARSGPFDYILVATKALADAKTSQVIAPAVTQGRTALALIQNGIGIEDEFAKAFPSNPLLSCAVYLPTTQIQPGHIHMGNVERLEVGTYPASAYGEDTAVREAADHFVEMMKTAGSRTKLYEDIQEKRWSKLLLNAAWNPICALTLSRDVAFLASHSSAIKLVEQVMLEVVAVARKLGYESMDPDAALEQLKHARRRIGGKGIEPSMLVDVLNGRRMEVDVILGNPIKIARDLGVQVPRLETLYGLTKALDESIAFRQPGQSLAGDETRSAREHVGSSTL